MAEKPQVYINVSGGVAEATVTRGDVEIIKIDWDDVGDMSVEEMLERRPDIEKISDTQYRDRLLADLDKLVEELREDDVADQKAAEERRRQRLADARALLAAEGETE